MFLFCSKINSTKECTQTLLKPKSSFYCKPEDEEEHIQSMQTNSLSSLTFMHKIHILVDTLELARTVKQKQNHRRQKARIVHLVTFLDPRTILCL